MSEENNFFALFTSNVHRITEQYDHNVKQELEQIIESLSVFLETLKESEMTGVNPITDYLYKIGARQRRLYDYGMAIRVLINTVDHPDFANEFGKMYNDKPDGETM